MATFGPQVTVARAAVAIGIEHNTLKQWSKRYGSLPRRKPSLLTVPETCALRCAVIATYRHNFATAEAVELCLKLATPAIERLLKGEQRAATLELSSEKTGTSITMNLNAIIAHVLPLLGLGFASRRRATDVEMLAAVEALERYTHSPEFLAKLQNLHSEITRTGKPMLLDDALRALGLPQWVGRLGIASRMRGARNDDHVDDQMLAAELSRLTAHVAALKAERR